MTRRLGLIVTDASPLITLAAGEALGCLTMPGLPVIIPDMVYFEVAEDLARLGAQDIVEWARKHRGQVEIIATQVFFEFQTLRAVNPRTRSDDRGEQSALEVLNMAITEDPDLEAVLFFEDSDVRKRRFVSLLPERVMTLSTGDLLHELEKAGLIQSSDHILDRAAEKERNIAVQREPQSDDEARTLLRTASTSWPSRTGSLSEHADPVRAGAQTGLATARKPGSIGRPPQRRFISRAPWSAS